MEVKEMDGAKTTKKWGNGETPNSFIQFSVLQYIVVINTAVTFCWTYFIQITMT